MFKSLPNKGERLREFANGRNSFNNGEKASCCGVTSVRTDSESPDFSSDGGRQSVPPQISGPPRVALSLPIRQDLVEPNPDGFRPGILDF